MDNLCEGETPSLKDIIEVKDESCSWCLGRNNCPYYKDNMETARKLVNDISKDIHAYFSISIQCDYYTKDKEEYAKYHIADTCINKTIRNDKEA